RQLLANVLASLDHPVADLRLLAPDKPDYGFYSVVLGLAVLALVFLLTRVPRIAAPEARRARLFVLALSAMFPYLLYILSDAAADRFDRTVPISKLAYYILFALFCSVPFTASYTVVVYQVLNVRLIARKALQYALARYSAITLAVVPLGALVAYIVKNRDQTIVKIFSGGSHLLLLGSSARVGIGALRYRRTLLDSIARRFFREQYDARQTLTLLVERIRSTHGVSDLANLLCREVALALHPESVSLMAFEPRSGVLADPKLRS